MVTMVLLNVALMWAMPRLTFRRCLRFLLLATGGVLLPTRVARPEYSKGVHTVGDAMHALRVLRACHPGDQENAASGQEQETQATAERQSGHRPHQSDVQQHHRHHYGYEW